MTDIKWNPLDYRVLLALLVVGVSCQQRDPIQVTDAWIRVAPPSSDVAAGFMVIENKSPQDNALLAVETVEADTVEIHEMAYENEMMKMRPVSEVVIPGGSKAELKPGGYHLMLFGMKSQPAENDSVFLTLYFKDQTTRIAKAFVRRSENAAGSTTQPASEE